VEAFRYFQSRLRESLSAVRLDRELPDAGPAAHRAVVDAIVARDPEAAAQAAEAVIVPTLHALEALL
jgi:DNA-binding FadR family transcriptional regulator